MSNNKYRKKISQTETKYFTCDQNEQTDVEVNNESYSKYPCNYCATNIANKYHLAEHIGKCRGTLNMGTPPGLPNPCFPSPLPERTHSQPSREPTDSRCFHNLMYLITHIIHISSFVR